MVVTKTLDNRNVRRVTLITNPYTNEITQLPWILGQDNRGSQYQITLDALPPGVNLGHIKQDQIWFVENTTTAYRLTMYAGTTSNNITISGTDTGLLINEGASGYYINLYDTTTQTVSGINLPTITTFNTKAGNNGILLVSGSQITFQNAGVYNVQFSAQVYNSVNGTNTTNFWLRKNRVDIPWTAGQIDTTNQQHYILPSWNYLVTAASGDNIQLMWTSTASTMQVVASSNSIVGPSIPSFILTAWAVASAL